MLNYVCDAGYWVACVQTSPHPQENRDVCAQASYWVETINNVHDILLLTDINECRNNPRICSDIDSNSVCSNFNGGYSCNCNRGYMAYYNTSVSPRVLFNCTGKDYLSLVSIPFYHSMPIFLPFH